MRFSQTLLAGAALVMAVFAQKPTIDSVSSPVTAGKTVDITYSPKDAVATFILRKGEATNLQTLFTVTEAASGGKFTWSVPTSLVNAGDYALQIKTSGGENYLGPFAVVGGVASGASSSVSATSSRASASSAASSGSSVSSRASTASASSASASAASTSGANSTVSTATLSTATSRPSGSATSSGPPQATTGAASMLSSSPMALIFGAVAAFAYLN